MDALAKLEIQSACRNLVLSYGRYNDQGNSDALAQLFAPDGIWERPGDTQKGREAIRSAVKGRAAGLIMRNVITNVRIKIVDDDHAEGEAYYTAYRHVGAGLTDADLPREFTGPAIMGEYTNRFVRTPEGWRIAYHTANRVFRNQQIG